jgi:hypothetical protein
MIARCIIRKWEDARGWLSQRHLGELVAKYNKKQVCSGIIGNQQHNYTF